MYQNVNIHYNIAALVVCFAVLVQYVCIKHVKSKTMIAYLSMLVVQIISSVFGILFYTSNKVSAVDISLAYFFGITTYVSTFSLGIAYLIFFLNLIRKDKKYTVKEKLHLFLPGAVVAGFILFTPVNHFAFYIDDRGAIMPGAFQHIIYAVGLMYLMVAFIFAFRHKSALTTSQAIAITLYSFITLFAGILQIKLQEVLLINFGQSVAMFLILISMQNDMNDEDKVLGTFNEYSFSKLLFNKLQKKNNMFIVTIQFNDFVDVNKLVGFDEANEILRGIADKVMEITPLKYVFHSKGIKFNCVLMKNKEYVETYVEKIRELLDVPVKVGEEKMNLSYNLLVTEIPQYGKRAEDIVDLIDYTLNSFKSKGCALWINEDLYDRYLRKNVIEKAIERGLKEDNFLVYYQPIMSTDEHKIKSAEALVRLKDPIHGMIFPDEFIPIAERNGTIIDIDAVVFEKVCSFIKSKKLWEKSIEYIEVNLSPIECIQENLHKKIIDVMDKYQINRNQINLEITETAAVSNNFNANTNIINLIGEGLSFSLDDFGTGFSNTTQLIELPFKMIKVDKSILWLAMKETKALSVLKHTISMLHDLYREIIVEGVETEEQEQLLTDLGCQHLQGYLYSKPLPEEEFLNYIENAA